MKNKVIVGVIISIVVICILKYMMTFDFNMNPLNHSKVEAHSNARFTIIHEENSSFASARTIVYVDKYTKVCYLAIRGINVNSGAGITVMLDSDGKPLLYDKYMSGMENK